MIAYLKGKITSKEPTSIIVECNGLGYIVKISLNTFSALKDIQETTIYTYFQVKEDAQILYGFFELSEKNLFEHLISVNGIGGNTALMMLSGLNVSELTLAIVEGKINTLKGVKGVGEKTAARIILELKDKLSKNLGSLNVSASTSIVFDNRRSDAINALITLGFKKTEIEKKIDDLLKSQPELAVDQIIKFILKSTMK